MFTQIWRTIKKCRWFSVMITTSWLVMFAATFNVSSTSSVKFIHSRLLLNFALGCQNITLFYWLM